MRKNMTKEIKDFITDEIKYFVKELMMECADCGCLLLHGQKVIRQEVVRQEMMGGDEDFDYLDAKFYCKIHAKPYDRIIYRLKTADKPAEIIYIKKEVEVNEKGETINKTK